MRLYLLGAFLALTIIPAHSQDSNKKTETQCQSFSLRSDNFYKVTKLRQFNSAYPQWVKINNNDMYYNLNGNTFRVAERQQDDVIVSSNIQAPYTATVKDTNGNDIHQNGSEAFVYLDKNAREYKINIDDESDNNDYRFIMDPISQIVFILSKTKNGNGPMFWFTVRRPGDLKNNLILTKKISLFGNSITSMHFNNKTRQIILGAKVKNKGIVYLLDHYPKEPCVPSLDLENLVLGYVNETYKAYESAVLKKRGSEEQFTCPARRKNVANENACTKLNDYMSDQHAHLTSSVNMLINANKDLQKELDDQKVMILDAVNKLHRLSRTAILNKGLPEPVFSETLKPGDVEEYVSHKYVCVSNDELKKGEQALDISGQLNFLKDAIMTVEEDLTGEPKVEDLYADIFGMPKATELQSDAPFGVGIIDIRRKE